MDFISNRQQQVEAMLTVIKASSIDELFSAVPQSLKLARPTEDDGLSEFEGMQFMEAIAKKNTFASYESYLGAGAYEHHVPSLVNAICAKSEFLTSYTPYQPEASQGMLQAIFEFQSAVCALTGMDVSNASLYDGATACAEALLMTLRLMPERHKVVVSKALHPHYAAVVEQYLSSHNVEIAWIPFQDDGTLDLSAAKKLIDDKTAAVLLAYPNFFGVIDSIASITSHAAKCGALSVICANPLVYGLFASAEELGADIAVGDTQPFGLPLQFGGPYVGYIACKQSLIRQLPGRLVGETVDINGKRAFVLTLQAREQHIRREKATSNICTNQALAALASLVGILWYGNEGVKELALTNHQRAAYLKSRLSAIPGIKMMGDAPFFNEFAVSFGCPFRVIEEHFRQNGILPGIDLGKFFPEMEGTVLVAVTETKSQGQLDRYVMTAESLLAVSQNKSEGRQ